MPTSRPSNRVDPAFRRLENRSGIYVYEERRQHRSHRSWPTGESLFHPPCLSLSLSLSPSFSILTLFLPLPSFNLIFFLAPPLPRSFPTLLLSLSLSHSPFAHHHPFVPSSLSNPFFARSPSMAPPCFESPLYRVAPAITTHACHSASDVGHTLPALSPFRRPPPPLPSLPLSLISQPSLSFSPPPLFFPLLRRRPHSSACHLSRCVPRLYQHQREIEFIPSSTSSDDY